MTTIIRCPETQFAAVKLWNELMGNAIAEMIEKEDIPSIAAGLRSRGIEIEDGTMKALWRMCGGI